MTQDQLVEHPTAREGTHVLIARIIERYHETHRRELPELIALAQKVERVHGTDPNAPHGLARALGEMVEELESHTRKEEMMLFPAMIGGGQSLADAITLIRTPWARQSASFNPARPRIAAVMRHPLLWSLALWSGAHLVANGDLAHVLLFGAFAVMSLIAMPIFHRRARPP